MSAGTQKAIGKGSDCPELAEDVLRLYSMRFCPYAQRTRLVLAHKQIPHETVNINLMDKPDWYFEKNPEGKVPALERNGQTVFESAICDDYLDEIYPENPLTPRDPYEKAKQRILMELFSKFTSPYYKALRGSEEEKEEAKEAMAKALAVYEKALQGPYFGGDSPSMLDLHIWPWFERMAIIKIVSGKDPLPQDRAPKLRAWVETMMKLPAVKATCFTAETHLKFIQSYRDGTPDYDIGLA